MPIWGTSAPLKNDTIDVLLQKLCENIASAASFDSEVVSWVARVVAAGGSVSNSTQAAASAFMRSIKSASFPSLRGKILRLNLFAGDQLAACMVPLIKDQGSASDTNNNFVSGDYSESAGLTGNGTTKYIATGLIPSTAGMTTASDHVGVYNRSASSESTWLAGCDIAANTKRIALAASYGDVTYFDNWDPNPGGGRISVADVAGRGFYLATRRASNDFAVYKAGTSIISGATTAGSVANTNDVYIFGYNQDGSPIGLTSRTLAGYTLGTGLTAGEVTQLSTAFQTFNAAKGRSV